LPVLARLPLAGDELVLDVGCGSGRLTRELARRLPRGRVIGVDRSFNMLAVARQHLAADDGARASFVQADASHLPFAGPADALFSTATFHWVLDHPRLFRGVFAALKPGGRFVAQCGGGPNIQRLHDRAAALMLDPEFAPHFTAWQDPWEFADAETTAVRLAEAGFTDVETSLVPSPIVQPDAEAFAEFVTSVICRHHLAMLPDEWSRRRYVDRLTALAAADNPPFELDYWRLNISARRP
jgi:trans-aconitate 2-methyltransferase